MNPTRPLPRRLALTGTLTGGLLAGLAVTGPLLAVAEPAALSSSGPGRVVAHAVVPPTALHTRPAHRASRSARSTLTAPRFVLRTVAVGRTFHGTASWYGASFQGRRTASGERFDTNDLTAASRTLAFGTRLRVCRKQRCVVVRINDRGPYVSGRALDLSHAASEALGFSGVARVSATPVATRRVALHPRAKPVRRSARLAVPPARPAPASRVVTLPEEQASSLGVLAAGLVGTAGAGLTGRRGRTDLHVDRTPPS